MTFSKPAWAMKHAARWAISVALAMGLSFVLVGQLLSRSEVPTSSAKDIAEAVDLRRFSNEFIALFNEYTGKRPAPGTGNVNTFERWVKRTFQPRINDLRQRLLGSDLSNAEHSALLAAGDRASAMAAKPRDERALRFAQEAVLEAASQTDERVARMKSGAGLVPRRATPSFARP